VLGKLFGESGVKVFTGFALPGNDKALQELSSLTADGSLLRENSRLNASTANSALQSVTTKTQVVADSLLSSPTKELATFFDNVESRNRGTLGTLADLNAAGGQAVADFVVNSVKDIFKATVEIKVDGPAKVTGVRSSSDNLDIDVDTGKQMVSP
jgi:hypothetical protein